VKRTRGHVGFYDLQRRLLVTLVGLAYVPSEAAIRRRSGGIAAMMRKVMRHAAGDSVSRARLSCILSDRFTAYAEQLRRVAERLTE
jgi:hypothetical protein